MEHYKHEEHNQSTAPFSKNTYKVLTHNSNSHHILITKIPLNWK